MLPPVIQQSYFYMTISYATGLLFDEAVEAYFYFMDYIFNFCKFFGFFSKVVWFYFL